MSSCFLRRSPAKQLPKMEPELRQKLLTRAGRLLSERSYTCGEMRSKLTKLAEPSEADEIIDHLVGLNLLNDVDYAYNFAFGRIRQQGWGPLRVRQSLRRRQIADQVIEAAIERVLQDTGDETLLREYVHRHCRKTGLPKDRKGIHKLIAHLQRRGFADAVIYSSLRLMIPAAGWEHFETGE